MRFSILIDWERCKGYAFCIDACDRSLLRMSEKLNAMGYHLAEVMAPDDCKGRRQCAVICPDTAIEIEGEAD